MTRRDGWLVNYLVEVVFDTDNARTRYDQVGTTARCQSCGERLALRGTGEPLVSHARSHEPLLSTNTANGMTTGSVQDHDELAGTA